MATGLSALDPSRFNPQAAKATISYSDERYWNARYAEKGSDPKADNSFAPFEWYARYDQLKDLLQPILVEATPPVPPPSPPAEAAEGEEPPAETEVVPPKPRILILGCGTSSLGEDLYNEGYTSIMCLDRCTMLIEHLAAKHEAKQGLDFQAMDIKTLPQDWTGQFDVVIDKACLDTIACSATSREDIPAVLSGVNRVLKPLTGVFITISHAAAEMRQPMLAGTNDLKVVVSKKNRWRVSSQPVPKLLTPPADPGAKGGAAPKGGAAELKPSAAFRAEEHVYNMYVCRRPPPLVDDAGGWFDFWASPDTVLTRETLSRSLIKSLYVPEAERPKLREKVNALWVDCCSGTETMDRDLFVSIASLVSDKFATTVQES